MTDKPYITVSLIAVAYIGVIIALSISMMKIFGF